VQIVGFIICISRAIGRYRNENKAWNCLRCQLFHWLSSGIDFLVLGEMFKELRQNETSVWIYCLRKKKDICSNPSCTHLKQTNASRLASCYSILCRLTWETCYFERQYKTTDFKPSFTTIQKECGVYFSFLRIVKVPFHKIYSCFSTCAAEDWTTIIWIQTWKFGALRSLLGTPTFCASSPNDFSKDVFKFTPVSCSFFYISTRPVHSCYCLDCNPFLEKLATCLYIFSCLEHAPQEKSIWIYDET